MARRQQRGRGRRKPSIKTETQTLTIERLGHHGDGVLENTGRRLFISNALPGETVEAELTGERGKVTKILEASADRVEPQCRHFEECGGCSLQHLKKEVYANFKLETVKSALQANGIVLPVDPLIPIAAHSRRRATFVALNTKGGVQLGFHEKRSKRIVPLKECAVVLPEIETALPVLRALCDKIEDVKSEIRVTVLYSQAGLDVRIDGVGDIDFKVEQALINLAIQHKLARLALGGDVLIEPAKPSLKFGDVSLTPPPGGFVQATTSSEIVMADLVCAAVGEASYVADLFSGSGTFTFRLAEHARVHAVESDAAALKALQAAARNHPHLKPVTAERRDLFNRPLQKDELNKFEALILDPPRAGAIEQCVKIAQSAVQKLVYVSCSPPSFARDAAVLIEGGYTLTRVQPVDQFLFSHHIELVSVFERSE